LASNIARQNSQNLVKFLPSDRWCRWFLRENGYALRRITSNPFTPVQLAKQDELHQFNLERLAVLKSKEGLTDEFIIGKDEVGVFLFPQEKERWEKKGTSC
jgi:hypothetical protein